MPVACRLTRYVALDLVVALDTVKEKLLRMLSMFGLPTRAEATGRTRQPGFLGTAPSCPVALSGEDGPTVAFRSSRTFG